MKWALVSNHPGQKIYELRTGKKESLVTVTFHPDSGTIRIVGEGEKRVFLVGQEGFRRNRIILRNEYGIRMGQLTHEGGQGSVGTMEISDEQFTYLQQDGPTSRVAIYRNNDMLVVCEFPEGTNGKWNLDHYLLLLSLCWFMAIAEKTPEYA